MLKRCAAGLLCLASLSAQDGSDWRPALKELGVAAPAPAVGSLIAADVRAWAEGVVEGVSAAERAQLFEDRLAGDVLGRALAVVTLLQGGDEEGAEAAPQELYQQVAACRVLVNVARSLEVEGQLGATAIPEWLTKVRAPAAERGRALLLRLLRDHPGDVAAAQAIAEGSLPVFAEAAVAADAQSRRTALRRLGDEAGVDAYMQLFGLQLSLRNLDGARVTLASAAHAKPSFSLAKREDELDRLSAGVLRMARVDALKERIARAGGSDFLEFELACATVAEDVDERCRALVAADCQQSLPYMIMAIRAVEAGDVQAAREHVERARSMPGAGPGVAALLSAIAFPELGRRLAQAPDDVQAQLEVEGLLSTIDELLAGSAEPAAVALRELRSAGWPQTGGRELAQRLAETFVDGDRAPSSPQAYALALTGVLSGMSSGVQGRAEARRFLGLAIDEGLRARPLLMRQRAVAAMVTSIWTHLDGDAAGVRREAAAQAIAARKQSAALGDGAFAAYLEWTERWALAKTEAQRAEVTRGFGALDVSPVQDGAWWIGSAALVMGRPPGEPVDQRAFLRLRRATGGSSDPLTLVPLAVADMVRSSGAAQRLVEYLRTTVRDGRARNLLAVAEIEGGVGPAVAAASARQVLASEDWSETEARELAHGFWLRYQIEWNLGFAVSGPQFECSLTCEPVVLPKIGVATRLKQLARKR